MSREKYGQLRKSRITRLRDKGARILHSKHVLMMIVVLNLADCCLVLGELILDIHYIKGMRDDTEQLSKTFVSTIVNRYPDVMSGYPTDDVGEEELGIIYNFLSAAECMWPPGYANASFPNENVTIFNNDDNDDDDGDYYGNQNKTSYNYKDTIDDNGFHSGLNAQHLMRSTHYEANPAPNSNPHTMLDTAYTAPQGTGTYSKTHTVWVKVAHGLHKASIIILGVLVLESILKIICMGKHFLSKKLEMFDVVVVIVSFVVDLVLLKGLTNMKVQVAVLVVSLLLPWRVIRVVNSLIVAVLDHEHFRLKMMYKEKKSIASRLKELEKNAKQWDFHLQLIEAFCESEGIPKWKIRPYTALRRKQSTVSTMAALALSGILPGIIIGPSDRKMLNGTFDKCFLQTTDSTDSSTKPNNANSNALLPIPGIPITMPIRPNVTLNIPEVNFDIIDESDDSEDDEHIQQPITGSRSNVSISESPYFTPRHSILSDLGNSILRIGTPPRMTLDCYSTDMRPLMLHQTSLCSDSDESSDGRWAIEPHSEINTTQTHPV